MANYKENATAEEREIIDAYFSGKTAKAIAKEIRSTTLKPLQARKQKNKFKCL